MSSIPADGPPWVSQLFSALVDHHDAIQEHERGHNLGTCDYVFRVTELLDDPSHFVLTKQLQGEPETARTMVARFLGTAFHALTMDALAGNAFQSDSDRIVPGERRSAGIEDNGLLIGITGCPDVLIKSGRHTRGIVDLKVCTTGTPVKPEWDWQVRLYAWLELQAGIMDSCEELGILRLYRDWKAGLVHKHPNPYRYDPVQTVDLSRIESFIRYRVRLLVNRIQAWERGERLAFGCAPNNRFARRVTSTQDDLTKAVAEDPRRCEDWCRVASECPLYQAELRNGAPVPKAIITLEPEYEPPY